MSNNQDPAPISTSTTPTLRMSVLRDPPPTIGAVSSGRIGGGGGGGRGGWAGLEDACSGGASVSESAAHTGLDGQGGGGDGDGGDGGEHGAGDGDGEGGGGVEGGCCDGSATHTAHAPH